MTTHFLESIRQSNKDIRLLWASVFFRMMSFGLTNQVLTLYLNELGIRESLVGLFMTLVMIGDTLLSFLLTWYSHNIGLRKVMAAGALLMCMSGSVFASGTDSYPILLFSAILGVISPSGDETGPFKSIEEAVIAKLTPSNHRAEIYGIHMLLSALGTACGSLFAGILVQFLMDHFGMEYKEAYSNIFVVYTAIGALKFILMLFLSDKCEKGYVPHHAKPSASNANLYSDYSETEGSSDVLTNSIIGDSNGNHSEDMGDFNSISSQSTALDERRPLISSVVEHDTITGLASDTQELLLKLLISFMLDSFGFGFMPAAWVVYYFQKQFLISPFLLGSIFFATSIFMSFSAAPSAYFASVYGPIKATLVTLVPTAIFCSLIPLFGSLHLVWPAIVSVILQSTFSSMDVVPRQVLLTELITNHEELPRVLGIVNIGKTMARTVGPIATGKLAEYGLLWVGFQVLSTCLLLSGLILFINFRKVDRRILDKRNSNHLIE